MNFLAGTDVLSQGSIHGVNLNAHMAQFPLHLEVKRITLADRFRGKGRARRCRSRGVVYGSVDQRWHGSLHSCMVQWIIDFIFHVRIKIRHACRGLRQQSDSRPASSKPQPGILPDLRHNTTTANDKFPTIQSTTFPHIAHHVSHTPLFILISIVLRISTLWLRVSMLIPFNTCDG